ncbi:hypothetical protein KR018_000348 [Drosophila ironensis]|nr:hypothetical protein KR018_000348 [Drosophila ironensis]
MVLFYYICLMVALQALQHIGTARSQSTCPREVWETYMSPEYRSRRVPYQETTWFGGTRTRYMTQYYWEDKVAQRLVTKYSCCSGYKDFLGTCVPVCTNGCPSNKHCTFPEICSCLRGYEGADCHPVCPGGCSTNEICDRPSHCTCREGYKADPIYGCQPQCPTGCGDHSHCTEPGKCECMTGYAQPENSTACQPTCDPACGPNSHCQDVNVCACAEGYLLDERGQCTPFCGKGCDLHSTCVRPDECACDNGYASGNGECQPICSMGCPDHSRCLSPERCVCDPGYLMKNGHCEPICSPECSDRAQCVAPGVCECYAGYERLDNGTEGADGTEQQCMPKCSQGCPDGFCFAPEVCVCNIGYLMGLGNTCEPQCSLYCEHGRCTQPETCTCDPGFRFQEGSQHICEAICEAGCSNGDCVAPEVCICHGGYQPEDSNSTNAKCLPVCQEKCVNGTCSAPDQCSCLQGYTKANDSASVCKPNCSSNCDFGDCVAPEQCQCWADFQMTDGGCQPMAVSTTTEQYFNTTSFVRRDTASADFLQLQSSNCSKVCSCWVEYDEAGITNNAKCIRNCADTEDQPCRDLGKCDCEQSSGQLICTNDGEDNYSSEETRYVCRVLEPVIVNVVEKLSVRTALPRWMKVSLVGCGFILLVAAAVAGYAFYRRRRVRPVDPINEAIYDDCL